MRRDQVIGQILFQAVPQVGLVEKLFEGQKRLGSGFAHRLQHVGFRVLGGELDLAGNVVRDKLVDIARAAAGIGSDQIRADAGSDEDFPDSREVSDFLEQRELRSVVRRQGWAD